MRAQLFPLFGVLLGVACSTAPTRMFQTVEDAGIPDVAVDRSAPDAAPDVPEGPDRAPVRTNRDLVLPGAPMDAPSRFGGTPSASRAPAIVYPEAQTIFPPNLPSFEVHFTPGTGNELFEVSFAGAVTTLRVYTPCARVGAGCVLTLDAAQYGQIADLGRVGGGFRVQVRGTSTAGGSVGTSEERTLGVTQQELRGGVYWWNASGSIYRYEFGREDARSELFLAGNPIACIGCHALSRDGRRIAAGVGIPAPAQAGFADTASRARVGGGFGGNFGAFSPDLRYYLNSDGVRLSLLNGESAAPVAGLPENNMAGTMPDWSPNNTLAVFARPRATVPFPVGNPGHSGAADLFVMDWRGSTFGPPRMLLSSMGENNYYPGFSPDGQWVVFNRSSMTSYDAPDAHLWMVRADGSGAPVDLARANSSRDGNSWPKWAPFRETYAGELTESLMWITFSSRRAYGLRLADGTRAQLWMAAVRPDRISARTPDPSAPAFWLPFQDLNSGNHIAQWAEEVRRSGCMIDRNCPANETCIAGRCVGAPP